MTFSRDHVGFRSHGSYQCFDYETFLPLAFTRCIGPCGKADECGRAVC